MQEILAVRGGPRGTRMFELKESARLPSVRPLSFRARLLRSAVEISRRAAKFLQPIAAALLGKRGGERKEGGLILLTQTSECRADLHVLLGSPAFKLAGAAVLRRLPGDPLVC